MRASEGRGEGTPAANFDLVFTPKKKNSYLQTARRQFMGVQFSYFSIPNTGWLRSIKKCSETALALFPKQSGRYPFLEI